MAGPVFALTYADLATEAIIVRVDDDGTGAGVVEECDETDNESRHAMRLPC